LDERARSTLSETARQATDRSPVPVFVPVATDWRGEPQVMLGEHWFAFSGQRDGVTVAVQGTRLARQYDGIEPATGPRRVRGQPAFVSSNRRIWGASWIEGGVAYSLDVECAEADDDRCADERFVLEQANRLAYVGGDRSGEGGGAD
jgi:hypothetical protein